MNHYVDMPMFELIYVIINYGMGSKVMRTAKENGVRGGTVLLGKGTVNNSILNFLSLYDESKEIVLLGADSKIADHVLDKLNQALQFEKPNHGIVFTTGACRVAGSRCYQCETCEEIDKERGANGRMYQLIITIVERGNAEDVIDAANEAGAKGGTILNARGSGINETSKLFKMDIEPEKEMVMILSKQEITEEIVASIREKLELDQPGNGIIFVQDVNKAYGIYD